MVEHNPGPVCEVLVARRAREREHGYGLADPDVMRLQVLLPAANLVPVVVLGQDEVGLDPGNAAAGVDEQFGQALGAHAAALVQLVAALVGNRFDAALHGNAVGSAEQVQAFLVPKIDPAL